MDDTKLLTLKDKKTNKFLLELGGDGIILTDNIHKAFTRRSSLTSFLKEVSDFNQICYDYKLSKFYNIKGEYEFEIYEIEFIAKKVECFN